MTNVVNLKAGISDLEKVMKDSPESFSELPVKHHFSFGVYTRELFIPAGSTVVGKIHINSGMNMLVAGTVRLASDEGPIEITAPAIFRSDPGIQKAVYAIEDSIWVTTHPNFTGEEDIPTLEAQTVCDTYEELEQVMIEQQKRLED